MMKLKLYILLLTLLFAIMSLPVYAQQGTQKEDTFFLAKKKGLLGRFGKSISRNVLPDELPEKLENFFLKYKGKFIRNIIIERLDFRYNIQDTNEVTKTFGIRIANLLHKQTSEKVISRNLFFKKGDRVFPNMIADNERYLRELSYIEDARIVVESVEGTDEFVDVLVLTKDNFSIGGDIVIDTYRKGRVELKDENLFGTGNYLMINGLYDKKRNPETGFGAEFINRNIAGSFMNLAAGYKSYNNAFNSGRNEEEVIYAKLDKPLVTAFIRTTGGFEWSYRKTKNAYVSDSLFNSDYKYEYFNVDGWLGYSLNTKKKLYSKRGVSIHKFVALRVFNQQFIRVPDKYKSFFDYRYTAFTGVLASINIFRQFFYTTNFIFGFGRNEDIPEGFNVAFTTGYINKESIKRPYAGIDIKFSHFNNRGAYYNYTISAGSYFYKKRFEDVELLLNLEHFTRLRKLGIRWYQRTFLNTGLATQFNPALNTPLFLNSNYGLPYFNNAGVGADLRATLKAETVFYNTKKILGFRLAPFLFADFSLLKPSKEGINKSDLFSALGGGVRTRNENLVFGTIEIRGYYFPRTIGNMKNWKVELNSNIRFKYKSSYIRRPDFILAN